VLEKSGISAIYTSEAVRTQQTAAPTASLLGITPTAVASADVAGLVGAIRGGHSGQTVLVVGHSNTAPQIIAEFGGPAVTIAENEYDNFFVLTLCRCRWQSVKLTNLQYGAASP
jgi:broad specificity phosphatase PhoE